MKNTLILLALLIFCSSAYAQFSKPTPEAIKEQGWLKGVEAMDVLSTKIGLTNVGLTGEFSFTHFFFSNRAGSLGVKCLIVSADHSWKTSDPYIKTRLSGLGASYRKEFRRWGMYAEMDGSLLSFSIDKTGLQLFNPTGRFELGATFRPGRNLIKSADYIQLFVRTETSYRGFLEPSPVSLLVGVAYQLLQNKSMDY